MKDTKTLPNGNWSEGVHDVTGQAGGFAVTSTTPLPPGFVAAHLVVFEEATVTLITGGVISNAATVLAGRAWATGLALPVGGVTALTVSSGVIIAYK